MKITLNSLIDNFLKLFQLQKKSVMKVFAHKGWAPG